MYSGLPYRVKTPNYELYGAMTVDIRVNISGEGWTVNKIQFNYFANTSAKNCLAYGPGLLPQVSGQTHCLYHSIGITTAGSSCHHLIDVDSTTADVPAAETPCCLQGEVFGVEMPFIIQAKDTCNNKRSSGGDLFTVSFGSYAACFAMFTSKSDVAQAC